MSEGKKCIKSLAILATSAVALQLMNPEFTSQVTRDLSLYEGFANYSSYYLGEGFQWLGTVTASLAAIGSSLSAVYHGSKGLFEYVDSYVSSKLKQ